MPIAPQSPQHPPISEQWQINKFLWACLLFLVVFIPVSSAQGWINIPVGTAFAILAVAVVNAGLRTYFAWRSGGSNGRIGLVFTTVDVILVSVAVRVTLGIRSELWLLYFVLLIAESMFATGPETAFLMTIVSIGYLAGTWPANVDLEYPLIFFTRLFFLGIGGLFARRMTYN